MSSNVSFLKEIISISTSGTISFIVEGLGCGVSSWILSAYLCPKFFKAPSFKEGYALGYSCALGLSQYKLIKVIDSHTTKFQKSYPKAFQITNFCLERLTTWAHATYYLNACGYNYQPIILSMSILYLEECQMKILRQLFK